MVGVRGGRPGGRRRSSRAASAARDDLRAALVGVPAHRRCGPVYGSVVVRSVRDVAVRDLVKMAAVIFYLSKTQI